jgi:hypothetical protein
MFGHIGLTQRCGLITMGGHRWAGTAPVQNKAANNAEKNSHLGTVANF